MCTAGLGAGEWAGVCRTSDIASPLSGRAEWAEKFAAEAIEKPPIKGAKRVKKAQWLRREIRVRARHLRAKGTLRHATVKDLIEH